MRLVKIDGVYINVDMVDAISFGSTKGITHVFIGGSENPFTFNRGIDEVAAIIDQEIEKPYLEKLRADIEVAYYELDGYDPDALGTFASRIDDLIDNLLSESEVKANENEK